MAYIKMLPSIFEDGHATVGQNLVRYPTRADYRHHDCRREGGESEREGVGRERERFQMKQW
jgi:hypothetical protein